MPRLSPTWAKAPTARLGKGGWWRVEQVNIERFAVALGDLCRAYDVMLWNALLVSKVGDDDNRFHYAIEQWPEIGNAFIIRRVPDA